MKNIAWMLTGYFFVAILGSLSAYVLVNQFVPTAYSQTEDLIEPALEPPTELEDAELTPDDSFENADEELSEGVPLDESELEDGPATEMVGVESLISDGYHYDPGGKRNPFSPFLQSGEVSTTGDSKDVQLTELQRFDLSEIRLVGIMWNIDKPKAMVVTPDKKVHVIGMNDKMGRNNGYVAVIREDEIIVIESFEEAGEVQYNTRVVSMSN